MSCDDYCCNHGCNQGRNCVARKTPAKASERAAQFQADTDRQTAKEAPDDTDELDGDIGEIVIVGAVAIIGLVLAPYAAGYLSHMQWK